MRSFSRTIAIALGTAMITISAPAFAQDDVARELAKLKEQNARLTARIAELEKRVHGGAPASSPAPVASPPPPVIVASSNGSTAIRGMQATTGGRTVEVVVPPAPADRPVQGGGIGLELNAASQGSQVSITIGQSVRATHVQDDQVRASGTAWSITASAPIDKGGGDTSLATLDSFTDSATLKFRVGQLWMQMPNLLTDPDYLAIEQQATDGCEAKAGTDPAKRTACEEADIDEDFIKTNAPGRLNDYLRMMRQHRHAFGIGLEASVGYRHYSFVDAATAVKGTSDKVPWGMKLYGTFMPGHGSAITASAAYQHGYKEGDSRVVCPVRGATTAIVCQTGPDGQPARKDKVLLALEGRKLFDLSRTSLQNGVIDRIGLSPQFTYDAKNDDVGFDLPIYVVPDAKGNLIGGVRLGYKTLGSDFIAGVFVGSSFDLFKR